MVGVTCSNMLRIALSLKINVEFKAGFIISILIVLRKIYEFSR